VDDGGRSVAVGMEGPGMMSDEDFLKSVEGLPAPITAAEAAFLNATRCDFDGRPVWTQFEAGYSRYSPEVISLARKGWIEVSRMMVGPLPSQGYRDVWRITTPTRSVVAAPTAADPR
jgi:hypothetical protein